MVRTASGGWRGGLPIKGQTIPQAGIAASGEDATGAMVGRDRAGRRPLAVWVVWVVWVTRVGGIHSVGPRRGQQGPGGGGWRLDRWGLESEANQRRKSVRKNSFGGDCAIKGQTMCWVIKGQTMCWVVCRRASGALWHPGRGVAGFWGGVPGVSALGATTAG